MDVVISGCYDGIFKDKLPYPSRGEHYNSITTKYKRNFNVFLYI